MQVRIGESASDDEAAAVAAALAKRFGQTVAIYVGDAVEPTAVHEVSADGESGTSAETTAGTGPAESTDGLGPTEREETLRDEIADIHEGGPEKYKEQLPEEGKLFVRDRIDLWFGEEGFRFEDGTFAEFDADDRLPADGLITGGAEFEGRDVHFMANDWTVKRGSMAEKGVEKFLRMQERALKTGRPVLYLMDSSGGRIDQQTGFFA
ncbi:MAG: carboxyl transferase domain-containing protein, partial [Halobacteriales archaeon]